MGPQSLMAQIGNNVAAVLQGHNLLAWTLYLLGMALQIASVGLPWYAAFGFDNEPCGNYKKWLITYGALALALLLVMTCMRAKASHDLASEGGGTAQQRQNAQKALNAIGGCLTLPLFGTSHHRIFFAPCPCKSLRCMDLGACDLLQGRGM